MGCWQGDRQLIHSQLRVRQRPRSRTAARNTFRRRTQRPPKATQAPSAPPSQQQPADRRLVYNHKLPICCCSSFSCNIKIYNVPILFLRFQERNKWMETCLACCMAVAVKGEWAAGAAPTSDRKADAGSNLKSAACPKPASFKSFCVRPSGTSPRENGDGPK